MLAVSSQPALLNFEQDYCSIILKKLYRIKLPKLFSVFTFASHLLSCISKEFEPLRGKCSLRLLILHFCFEPLGFSILWLLRRCSSVWRWSCVTEKGKPHKSLQVGQSVTGVISLGYFSPLAKNVPPCTLLTQQGPQRQGVSCGYWGYQTPTDECRSSPGSSARWAAKADGVVGP